MAVRFQCSCGKKLKASDEKIGKKVLCSGCGKSIRVPDADAAPKRKSAPSAPSVSSSSTSAAHIASDLLKRTDTEVKSRASVEEERPESEIDLGLTVRSFMMSVLPGTAIFIVILTAAYVLSSTLFRNTPNRPELATVSGTVTLDGVPLKGAEIAFAPIPQGGERQTDNLGASYGMTDAEGKYSLYYVRDAAGNDIDGAVLGPHRVQIWARGPDGRQRIPPIYNSKTQLTAQVESGDNTGVDFPLRTVAQ